MSVSVYVCVCERVCVHVGVYVCVCETLRAQPSLPPS